MNKILVVDDDPSMVAVLSEALRGQGHEVVVAGDPERAWKLVGEHSPALVLTDVEMPTGKPAGLDLLRRIKEHTPDLPVLVLTGHATKARAVEALRAGAQDFIEKPFQFEELLKRVDNALLLQRGVVALQENAELRQQLDGKYLFDNLIGSGPSMEAVFHMVRRVAASDATVLLLGETGTGKEMVARALHAHSRRAAQPFIAINCAALPEHLLESELFGHKKGAFTGAAFDKVGLFQAAEGGTIFLDEIGSLPMPLQSKLLRFLQDRELRRVGDTAVVKVDVRVLAATNEALEERIKEHQFREDLFYRISVIPIQLPPLRKRVEDIPLLTTYFIQAIARREKATARRIGDDALAALQQYAWPGNVRELQNVIERACVMCDDGLIRLRDLPPHVLPATRGLVEPVESDLDAAATCDTGTMPFPMLLKDYIQHMEVAYIEKVLAATGGNKTKTAQLLGVSTATLYRRLHPDEVEELAEAVAG